MTLNYTEALNFSQSFQIQMLLDCVFKVWTLFRVDAYDSGNIPKCSCNIARRQAVHSHSFHSLTFMTQTALYRCTAAHFHSLQKQLLPPLHNSIIFCIENHEPEALLVSSSSSSDSLSVGDTYSYLSPPRIRK